MPPIGYMLAAVALLGLVAIFARQRQVLRRWVIYIYCCLMAFLAFAIFVVGPRMARSSLEAAGGIWSAEAAKGANAMHDVYMALSGMLFIIALVLAVLALRPPK